MTTPTTVNVQFQIRADTAANWTAANPILLVNEFALEADTKKLKVGNGSTAWNSLAYFPSIVSGGTVLGNLEIGSTGTLTFEGSTADGFETTLAVTNPTADRTITLPNQSGTVVVSGNASIVNADIAANAEIAVSKLANGTANQVLVTDGTDVSWSDNLILAGDLTVNGTTTTVNSETLLVKDKNIEMGVVDTPTDSTADGGGITLKGATDKTINWIDATDAWTSSERFSVPLGSAASPSLTFTGDENTGIYSPGADQVAVATNGVGRLFVDASGNVCLKKEPALPDYSKALTVVATDAAIALRANSSGTYSDQGIFFAVDAVNYSQIYNDGVGQLIFRTGSGLSERLRITSAGTLNFKGAGTAGVTQAVSFNGSAPVDSLVVDSTGRVGIGTSSPGRILDIVGSPIARPVANTTNAADWFFAGGITATSDPRVAVGIVVEDSVNNKYAMTFGTQENFSTGIAEKMRISSAGNVGIGTTSPDDLVDLQTPSSGYSARIRANASNFALVRFVNNANNNTDAILGTPGSNTLAFYTNGFSERARIDSSGRLLVGTSNSTDNARFNSKISVVGTGAAQLPGVIVNGYTGTTNPGDAPFIDLGRSRGTTDGSYTEVVSNDYLGYIVFRGADGVGWSDAATISAQADGDWTTSGDTTDSPGRLVFSTTADGASSPTERMRITSAGRVLINTISSVSTANATLEVYNATDRVINCKTGVTTGVFQISFNNPNGLVGRISTDGSATAYTTSSDYRLKENVVDLEGAIDRLKQLPVRRFNFIADPVATFDGFIAHEAQAVVPECVTGVKDEVDDDGNPVYQGIDQSKLVPLLTAALQEAIGEIESLKARVTALETP